jgi:hypothetical protein
LELASPQNQHQLMLVSPMVSAALVQRACHCTPLLLLLLLLPLIRVR